MTYFNKITGYPKELEARFNSFITTQFDDSMSVEMQLRSLIKWITSTIDLVNNMADYLNMFIDRFDEKLQREIVVRLNNWLEDGTLAHVINKEVFDMKVDREEFNEFQQTINNQLDEITKSVEEQLRTQNEKIDRQLSEQNERVDRELTTVNEKVHSLEKFEQTEQFSNNMWSWWIYPLAVYKDYKTFFASTDNNGVSSIHSYDHVTKQHIKTPLMTGIIDDHNSPAIAILDTGRIVVFYTQHNNDNIIRYRISDHPYDVSSFGSEKTFATNQNITYIQVYVDKVGRVHLFTRRANKGWYYLRSDDNTNSWSVFRTLIIVETGQFYLKIKPSVSSDGVEQIRMAFTGHPQNSPIQEILYCYMNLATGEIRVPSSLSNNNLLGNVNTGEGVIFELADLVTVYKPPVNKRTRLFDVNDQDLGFAFAEFTDNSDGVYKYAKFNGSSFDVYTIGPSGSVIGGGDRQYLGGMIIPENKRDELIVSREENGEWFIDRIRLRNNRWLTYNIERDNEKMFRPIVPVNADVDVLYIKGYYNEEKFTDFDTDLIFKYNMAGNAKTGQPGSTITGISTMQNSEVIVIGNDQLKIQRSKGFYRVDTSPHGDSGLYNGSRIIEFPVAFKETPDVFVSSRHSRFVATVARVTESSFEVNVLRAEGTETPENVPIHWFAIGK